MLPIREDADARTPSVSVHLETAPSGQRARSAQQRPTTTAAWLGMNGVIRRMASRQHKSRKFSISPDLGSRLLISVHIAELRQISMHACIPEVRSRPVAPPHSSRVKAGGMTMARCGVLPKRKGSTRTSLSTARMIKSCKRVRMM